MAVSFSSSDVDVINKSVNIITNFDNKDDLSYTYELDKCIEWIESNRFKKVCLQFPDEMLHDSVEVALHIEQRIKNKVYILADTSYRSCCIHDITADHINADCVIHYGHACLALTYKLPVLYIFPKVHFDVSKFFSCISRIMENNDKHMVLLYDVVFVHCIDHIRNSLSKFSNRLITSTLVINNNEECGINCKCKDPSLKKHIVTKLGRSYCPPPSNCIYVYIAKEYNRKNVDNFVMSLSETEFYSYTALEPLCLKRETIPIVVKKALYKIEKIKDARIIGILVAASPTTETLLAIQRVKTLCHKRGKKSYILYVGYPNVAKLANFPEIDVFVFISCPEAELTDEREYYRPIVNMMEIELALNNGQSWKNEMIIDFCEFLPGGSAYTDITEVENEDFPDVSLLSNRLRSLTTDDHMEDNGSGTVSSKDPLTVKLVNGDLNQGLAGRSWKGLERNVDNISVQKASVGRSGIPSTGYKHTSSDNIT